jgi:predicted site-specific integrase-resolvase
MPRRNSKITDSPPNPRWLRTEDAARYLGVSVSQITRWRKAGRLIPSKPSGERGPCWYSPADLDELMQSSRAK